MTRQDVGLDVDAVAGASAPSVVAVRVSGISDTSNQSSPTALTVRLTPSTAIEPLRATSGACSRSSEKRSTRQASPGSTAQHLAGAVDVALHDVPADPVAEGGGALDVDAIAGRDAAEGTRRDRDAHHIRGEPVGSLVDDGEAHAADRDRVAVLRVGDRERRLAR